jgi:hypothetical protein
VARGRDATRSSLRSRFGSAIHQFAPPFRKRSVMDEDLEIRPSAESPGSAINQATRAHFANAIQRLKDERRYRVFIDLDRDATRFPTAVWRPNGSQEQHEVTIWCSNDYLGMGGHPEIREAAVAAVERHGAGAGHPQHLRYASSNSRARSGIVTSSVFTAHHWAQDSLIRAKRRRLRRYRLPTSRCGRSGRIGCGCAANL